VRTRRGSDLAPAPSRVCSRIFRPEEFTESGSRPWRVSFPPISGSFLGWTFTSLCTPVSPQLSSTPPTLRSHRTPPPSPRPRRLQSLTQCRLPSILGARPCPRRRPTRVEPPTLPPLIPMPSPLLSAPSWPAPSAEKGVASKSILFRSSFLLTISLPRLGLTLLSSSRCFLFPLQEGPV
jgi:hypothetical protein